MLSEKEFLDFEKKMNEQEKLEPPLGDYIEQFSSNYMSEPPEDFFDKLIEDRLSVLTKEDTARAVEVFKILIKWRDENV